MPETYLTRVAHDQLDHEQFLAAAGAGDTFVFDQVGASTTWVIVHGLGLFPNVTTVDTGGTVIHGTVVYDSAMQITVTFTIAQSGHAYLS